VRGERYVIDPLLDADPRNRKREPQFLSTPGVVRALKDMLNTAGHPTVVELFDWFFIPSIRNAFSHADYTLHDDKLRARTELFDVGGIRTPELQLEVLAVVPNRALVFYDAFMSEYDAQRSGYQATRSSSDDSPATSQRQSSCSPTRTTGSTGSDPRPRRTPPSSRAASLVQALIAQIA